MYCLSLVEDSPEYNLDQSNTLTAIEGIQSFVRQYPENEKRDQIQGLIGKLRAKLEQKSFENAKLFYLKEDYKAALIALENFRKDYPDSEYNEEAAYLRIINQYNYVNNSVDSKKKERLQELVEMYETYVDRYPKSKFTADAETYYIYATKELGKKPDGQATVLKPSSEQQKP
jgi:outer membrane protein assembly factor BamD